ncbi:MAG: hypothetical protein HRU19_13020 [Pseudobacteriovorax sp.]|nr:hypothetical protein [Pseudobacteriovorax sp.]
MIDRHIKGVSVFFLATLLVSCVRDLDETFSFTLEACRDADYSFDFKFEKNSKIKYSPSGKHLIIFGFDRITVFDIDTRKVSKSLTIDWKRQSRIIDILFSEESGNLYTVQSDTTVTEYSIDLQRISSNECRDNLKCLEILKNNRDHIDYDFRKILDQQVATHLPAGNKECIGRFCLESGFVTRHNPNFWALAGPGPRPRTISVSKTKYSQNKTWGAISAGDGNLWYWSMLTEEQGKIQLVSDNCNYFDQCKPRSIGFEFLDDNTMLFAGDDKLIRYIPEKHNHDRCYEFFNPVYKVLTTNKSKIVAIVGTNYFKTSQVFYLYDAEKDQFF